MKISPVLVASAVALGFSAVACSNAAPQPAAAPNAPVAQALPPQPVHVALGQTFEIPDATGRTSVRASFDAIEVDPVCTTKYGSVDAPQRGHYIAVKMTAETTPAYDGNAPGALGYPSAYDFQARGTDGVGDTGVYPHGAADLCIADRDHFSGPFMANTKYRGWVLLEATPAAGTLSFRPHFATFLPGWVVDYAPAPGSQPAVPVAEPTKAANNCSLNPADMDHKTQVQCGLVKETQAPATSTIDPAGGLKIRPNDPYSDPTYGPLPNGGTGWREKSSGEKQLENLCKQGLIKQGC